MAEPLDLNLTYEELLALKLAGVDDSLDKREVTSLIYNTLAANSVETIQMLVTLKNFTDMVFADTAPREYLIRRAAERGIKPTPATFALRKGVFNIDVPIGSRFSLDELNYRVVERTGPGVFVLQCEAAGTIGNLFSGQLIPIEYIAGLENAVLTNVLVPGDDEEETEAFRRRYFNSFASTAFGGNRADYKEKVGKLPGVGGVRIYRAWNGGGTVKLVIIDSQYQVPTQTLVGQVQEAVDPLHAQGEGLGIAPLDHIATVFPVKETLVNINLNITYQAGWAWADIEAQVLAEIDRYFSQLAEEWASSDNDNAGLVVRVSQIEYRLLGIPGVLDIANTQLNGGTSNIEINKESIPKRGVVSG